MRQEFTNSVGRLITSLTSKQRRNTLTPSILPNHSKTSKKRSSKTLKKSPRNPKMNSMHTGQIPSTTNPNSSKDIPNLDYIVACLKNFDDNYVYAGYVTNEPQKNLDCLSDAFDY